MATQSIEALERELRIAARPVTIWPFLVEPQMMTRWMGRSAELDPRPGGIYRVDMNGSAIARGEFLEVDPYRRVVFSWGWEGDDVLVPPGASTVEITLTEDGGATILHLRHLGLPEAERDSHGEGWDFFLPRLASAAEGQQ